MSDVFLSIYTFLSMNVYKKMQLKWVDVGLGKREIDDACSSSPQWRNEPRGRVIMGRNEPAHYMK